MKRRIPFLSLATLVTVLALVLSGCAEFALQFGKELARSGAASAPSPAATDGQGGQNISVNYPSIWFKLLDDDPEAAKDEFRQAVKDADGYVSSELMGNGDLSIVVKPQLYDRLSIYCQDNITEAIELAPKNPDYPGIVQVDHNEDYSQFTVHLDPATATEDSIYWDAEIYLDALEMRILHHEPGKKVVYIYKNAKTGEEVDRYEENVEDAVKLSEESKEQPSSHAKPEPPSRTL